MNIKNILQNIKDYLVNNYVKKTDSISWGNITDKPSYSLSSHTHDTLYAKATHTHNQYITSSGSCSYATSSGNSDTVDGSHAWQMQTLNANGVTHGSGAWVMQCRHNLDGDGLFKIFCGDGSIPTKVDRATVSDNGVESQGNNWIRFKDGTQICYLTSSCSSSGEVKSLPNSFKDSNYTLTIHHDIDATQIYVKNKTTTSYTVYYALNGYVIYDLIAIGKWK